MFIKPGNRVLPQVYQCTDTSQQKSHSGHETSPGTRWLVALSILNPREQTLGRTWCGSAQSMPRHPLLVYGAFRILFSASAQVS